jgi:hypothetical protein
MKRDLRTGQMTDRIEQDAKAWMKIKASLPDYMEVMTTNEYDEALREAYWLGRVEALTWQAGEPPEVKWCVVIGNIGSGLEDFIAVARYENKFWYEFDEDSMCGIWKREDVKRWLQLPPLEKDGAP